MTATGREVPARLVQAALVAGALSPAVVLAGWAVAAALGDYRPGVAGNAAVLGPLFWLALASPSPHRGRWLAWAAVGGFGPLAAGAALAFAPDWLFADEPPGSGIALRPGATSDDPGRYEVAGLSVRRPPVIRRYDHEGATRFGVDLPRRGGAVGGPTPCEREDGYGNGIAATLPRPGVLRLDDRDGGFAVIDWAGAEPVLIESRVAPRSQRAREPSELADRLVGPGRVLLAASPFAAWAVLSFVVASGLRDLSSRRQSLRAAGATQLVGLGLFALPIALAALPRIVGDIGAGIIWAMLTLVAAVVAMSVAGAGTVGMVEALLALWRHPDELAAWSRQQETQEPV